MQLLKYLLLFIILGCNNNGAENKVSVDSAVSAGNLKADTLSTRTEQSNDSVIIVKFPKDSFSVKVEGRLKGINHPVTVIIPVKQGQQLTAFLQPKDSLANARINQIFMPDGKADGPFGKDLKYAIKQPGDYKLIIGENLMQGDEWKGEFWLTVTVK